MINVAEINWAKPSNYNASQLIHLNNQEAIESLIYLSEFIEVDVKLLNTLSIDRFKNKLYKHMPQLYITHEAVKTAVEDGELNLAKNYITSFINLINKPTKDKSQSSCRILRYSSGYNKVLMGAVINITGRDRKTTYKNNYRGEQTVINVPTESQFIVTSNIVKQVFSILERIEPIHYDEINTVVNEIIVIESNGINAATYLNHLGAIYIRAYKEKTEHWSRIVEHITHEAAHNLLYHIWFRERILIDDNGLFYTPFRLDYRPISGVFHAMFVLARTIYTFNYLLQAEISNLSYEDISSHYNEANNTLKFKEKFRQTVNVLNSSKKLTVFGEKIINDCIELVHKCHIGI
ncbi:HEXXH motif-containing putative peptide modification protein [Fastidiosibacter lacustris]|uniref:HEXXH motif-containing putative peptide modification protein n=1 Tax=Fastidiosibacter lacustris TaxID=2056695 RepID=UPI000E352D20|nr:HEXXH motif-containing putative peptide modification protein [Fastidiosibacter lacustris]